MLNEIEARRVADLLGAYNRRQAPRNETHGTSRHRIRLGTLASAKMVLLQSVLYPFTIVVSLTLWSFVHGAGAQLQYVALALIAFILAPRIVNGPELTKTNWKIRPMISRLLFEWSLLVGILLFLAFALKVSDSYSRAVILTWFITTPLMLVGAGHLSRNIVKRMRKDDTRARSYVIVGANEVGQELARRLGGGEPAGFYGYFDDRSIDRLQGISANQLIGKLTAVYEFAQRNPLQAVYIALPVWGSPRMIQLVSQLRDTTASIYIVPDLSAFELIQARFVDIDGIPAVSICDTPFQGNCAVIKRTTDLVIASVALALLSPVMLGIAAAIKLTSRGPVLFKQRRYGLDGEEILIYKFRSMKVWEDGAHVMQATRGDFRLTKIGGFLRRTSLDELPQLLNVVQGTMSLVGPRPHAVAHNEQYRKLIDGYMIRHKIKPGITGWAQVNGLRGETETIDKMQKRVEFDLDYLRQWSLWLDMKILIRTAIAITRDPNAY
ncbi:MAG TPA: undecaprenyl-phosphate glucose phosphotransferase [Longimicrobiales bacterium]|nr:undecaprenyl-phosphate glucose phosphotransferase [Longimicrobiales bacterium]